MSRRDHILSNGEFKIIRKILKREFPYIKDVIPSSVLDDYNTVTFLDIILDTPTFEETLGVQMSNIIKNMYKDELERGEYNTSYLPSVYRRDDKEALVDFHDNVRDTLKRINKSSAVPSEIKLKPKADISHYIFN
jgi:hypothetical protein